jgi:hypothetical protein
LDHTREENNNADTGGFDKLKLKIRNISATSAAIATTSPGGTMVAVAKFHRNKCYTPTLSGEYGADNPAENISVERCRSSEEESVTSARRSPPAGMDGGSREVIFDFPQRIPISATDLKIQVVYRGPLGEDLDAIAVGFKDISEPSYITQYSEWDNRRFFAGYPSMEYYAGSQPITFAEWCMGENARYFPSLAACQVQFGYRRHARFHKPGQSPIGYEPEAPQRVENQHYNLSELIPIEAHVRMHADVGRFNRVAMLVDLDQQSVSTVIRFDMNEENVRYPEIDYNDKFVWYQGLHFPATVNQMDPVTKTLVPSVKYKSFRGIFVHEADVEALVPNVANLIPAASDVSLSGQ